jgi:hypothetical protein
MTTYTIVSDPLFWTVIGFIMAAIGGLYVFLFNLKGEVAKGNEALNSIVKIFTDFMTDRKEKDRDFYAWKEKINTVKDQHEMITRAGNVIKSHISHDE